MKTLKGSGTLVVDGEDQGPATYDLTALSTARGKWAEGIIRATVGLGPAMRTNELSSIRLSNGTSFQFVTTSWRIGEEFARIKTSGPVPGL